MQSLYHPFSCWGGEENGKKKAELMGQNKGSLTEQQTKRTVTTTVLIRRIYQTNTKTHRAALTVRCPMHSSATINSPLAGSPTQNQAWQHMVSNTPVWVSCLGCVPSWLLVKINPILANPGHYPPIVLYHLIHAQVPHFPSNHHHLPCL